MSYPRHDTRNLLRVVYTSTWETALTHHAELVVGVLLGILIAQAISPVLAFIASMSVMFTVVGIALIERQRIEWALDQVEVVWETPTHISRGDSALITLTFVNPSTITLWGVEIAVRTPEGLSIEVRRDLPAGSQGRISGYLHCMHYGSGHLWGVELRAYDSMKLVMAERHLSAIQSLDVIPANPCLSWRTMNFGSSLITSTSHTQKDNRHRGQDGDFSELRFYQPGDGMRSVAWRPSARQGQLLTRVVERTTEKRYLFAVDLSAVMRTQVGRESRVDLALDSLLAWVPQLRGEQIGIVGFDHRLLVDLPMAPQARIQKDLKEFARYASKPLDHDCAIDTPDELWSRVMFFLEWSGQAITHQLSDGFLRNLHETRLSSSMLATNSYRLDFTSAYIHQVDLPKMLPNDPLDTHKTHDRLRRFCQTIGVTMTPKLPRAPHELTQGIQEVVRYAQKHRTTHLVILSHSQRLSSHRELRLLTQWARNEGLLSWIQVGAQEHTMPSIFHQLTASMRYIPLRKSSIDDQVFHTYDAGPWQWDINSMG